VTTQAPGRETLTGVRGLSASHFQVPRVKCNRVVTLYVLTAFAQAVGQIGSYSPPRFGVFRVRSAPVGGPGQAPTGVDRLSGTGGPPATDPVG
jgi:hypothetical protein